MSQELDHLIGDRTWLYDSTGGMVHRGELVSRIRAELDEDAQGWMATLIERVEDDTRKSFSKAKIIELIKEYL